MRSSPTDVYDISTISALRLSPDGETVALGTQQAIAENSFLSSVWAVDIKSGEREQLVAFEAGISEVCWSPDSNRLAFVSTQGDDDRPQLWTVDADGTNVTQVTNVVGGVAEVTWSPDGSRIAFLQETSSEEREQGLDTAEPGESLSDTSPDPIVTDRLVYHIEKGRRTSRTWETYFYDTKVQVYVVDVESGDVGHVSDGAYDHWVPEWGDSDELYYMAKRHGDPEDNPDYDILSYDLSRGEEQLVTTTTNTRDRVNALSVTADGRLAYMYRPATRASMRQMEIQVYDRDSDTTYTPTESIDRTIASYIGPHWGPDDQIYFVVPDEGSFTVKRAPWDASGPVETVLGGQRHVTNIRVGEEALLYSQCDWDHPGNVFASSLDGSDERQLTALNEAFLADREINRPEEIWFENGEGDEVQGWLMTPQDDPEDGSYPLIVQVHGGPHIMWSYTGNIMWGTSGAMWRELQTLTSRGYAVFWSNPRGSAGYGQEFMKALERQWGGPDGRDVVAGVEQLVERGVADERNLFLTGGSYGGFLTGWMVGQTDMFSAAIAQRGVYDLLSFYGLTDKFENIEWEFGTNPWEEPEFLWERSPVAHVEDVTTPTMIIQSEEDFSTPLPNAQEFYRYLKKTGVETQLVIYPREGHELSRAGEPHHIVDRLNRILDWFDDHRINDGVQ